MSASGASTETGHAARLRVRRGDHRGPTTALAPGYVQGNLMVLPQDMAAEFLQFCQRNPKACPLLAVSKAGDPHLPELGEDLDVRTDLPLYRVWRDGEVVSEVTDISDLWRADLVAFVLGCSFSFDHALVAEGISIPYVEQGGSAPAYHTNISTIPAGRMHGPLLVSMRSLKAADAIRAIEISSGFPALHGAPIHIGAPHLIGIKDLSRPEYGPPISVSDDEFPVFWACGVTPLAMIAASKLPFCITQAASTMLLTDLRLADLAAFQAAR